MDRMELEKLIIENKPVVCELCGGKMFYVHGGMYRCGTCEHEVLDDFGKVKTFLELNGPTPALTILAVTGVSTEVIELFLRQGRVEIPEGSKYYIKCQRCRCSIRYGRFRPECVQELANGLMRVRLLIKRYDWNMVVEKEKWCTHTSANNTIYNWHFK